MFKTEVEGISFYQSQIAELRKVLPQKDPKQDISTIVELYVQAARVKPAFDKLIYKMAKMCKAHPRMGGAPFELSICPTLKKTSRICEKSQMRGTSPGNVSGVKDIVRCVCVCVCVCVLNGFGGRNWALHVGW